MGLTTGSVHEGFSRETNLEGRNRTLRRMARLAAVGFVMALCSSPAWTQNYYSLQHTNWPPLPFLPFEVPVYDLGDGFLAYDDLAVNYFQSWTTWQEAMSGEQDDPPVPGEGGGAGGGPEIPPPYDFSTNDLWVEIVLVTN